MSKRPAFTQAEIKRMVEAARAAGISNPTPVWRRLPDGSVELTARSTTADSVESTSDWDQALGLN